MEKEKIITLYKLYGEGKDWEGFQSGVLALEKDISKSSALKEKRKSKGLVMTDFISNDKEQMRRRHFLNGVFHSEGYQVVTDARCLVLHKENYPADLEGKIISKDGFVIDGTYPSYKEIIPEDKDLIPADDFTLEDLKIIATISKSRSHNVLYSKKVEVNENCLFALAVLKFALNFWACFPGAKLYRQEDYSRSWVLTDGTEKFLFMPLYKGVICDYRYDVAGKVWTENK